MTKYKFLSREEREANTKQYQHLYYLTKTKLKRKTQDKNDPKYIERKNYENALQFIARRQKDKKNKKTIQQINIEKEIEYVQSGKYEEEMKKNSKFKGAGLVRLINLKITSLMKNKNKIERIELERENKKKKKEKKCLEIIRSYESRKKN